MTNEEIKENPWAALIFCSDKLTPEQFDYCKEKQNDCKKFIQ